MRFAGVVRCRSKDSATFLAEYRFSSGNRERFRKCSEVAAMLKRVRACSSVLLAVGLALTIPSLSGAATSSGAASPSDTPVAENPMPPWIAMPPGCWIFPDGGPPLRQHHRCPPTSRCGARWSRRTRARVIKCGRPRTCPTPGIRRCSAYASNWTAGRACGGDPGFRLAKTRCSPAPVRCPTPDAPTSTSGRTGPTAYRSRPRMSRKHRHHRRLRNRRPLRVPAWSWCSVIRCPSRVSSRCR